MNEKTPAPAPLPREEIERIDRLHQAATPGPWIQDDDLLQTESGDVVIAIYPDGDCPRGVAAWDDNASFIEAIRNAWPSIKAEIEAGRAGAERVRELGAAALEVKRTRNLYRAQGSGKYRDHFDTYVRAVDRLCDAVSALRQAAQPADGAPAEKWAADAPTTLSDPGEAAAWAEGWNACLAAMAAAPAAPAQVGAQPAGRVEPHPAAFHLHHAMDLLEKAAEFIDELPATDEINTDEWVWRHQYGVFLDPASAHTSFGVHGKPADHATPPTAGAVDGGGDA